MGTIFNSLDTRAGVMYYTDMMNGDNMTSIDERWEKGIPHDKRSEKIYRAIANLDFENGDSFCFKAGGDGDNGEQLMYLLDVYFEQEDRES